LCALRWADLGKFISGVTATWSVALPAILLHAQVITLGTFLLFLAAPLICILGATTYQCMSSDTMNYSYM